MDVYLNARRDLLIVRSGKPLPAVAALGNWRKTNRKKVLRVSDEIRLALEAQGYYMRKLKDMHRKKCNGSDTCAISTGILTNQEAIRHAGKVASAVALNLEELPDRVPVLPDAVKIAHEITQNTADSG